MLGFSTGYRRSGAQKRTPRYIPVSKNDAVGLYWANQASWEQPFRAIPRFEAHLLKDQQKGKFINHGKSFRLSAADPCRVIPNEIQPTKEDMARRDGRGRESCVVGEMTMFDYVLQIPRAVAIIQAWA